jgi:uncharacterized protein (DUF111 family)
VTASCQAGRDRSRLAWVDAPSGLDPVALLGAVLDVGASTDVARASVASLGAVQVGTSRDTSSGVAATACQLAAAGPPTVTAAAARTMIERAALAADVRSRAVAAMDYACAARPESSAVELATTDVAAVVALVATTDSFGVSRLVIADATPSSPHDDQPVAPKSLGEALALGVLATIGRCSAGPVPAMTLTGVGAGSRPLGGSKSCVIRLLLGHEGLPALHVETMYVVSARVTTVDPRLWPDVVDAAFGAGARDAWLTPRTDEGVPSVQISALCAPPERDAVRAELLRQIPGLDSPQETPVRRTALCRRFDQVRVGGMDIRVKVSSDGRRVHTAQPEYEDVAAAARALGRPIADVLHDAHRLWDGAQGWSVRTERRARRL